MRVTTGVVQVGPACPRPVTWKFLVRNIIVRISAGVDRATGDTDGDCVGISVIVLASQGGHRCPCPVTWDSLRTFVIMPGAIDYASGDINGE